MLAVAAPHAPNLSEKKDERKVRIGTEEIQGRGRYEERRERKGKK